MPDLNAEGKGRPLTHLVELDDEMPAEADLASGIEGLGRNRVLRASIMRHF